jgi:hypothetical protein
MSYDCKSPEYVLKTIKDNKIEMVDLRFADLPGLWQHFSVPPRALNLERFAEGVGFDGSSIRGLQEIQESDMMVIPDPTTAFLDTFTEAPTLALICNIRDPITGESSFSIMTSDTDSRLHEQPRGRISMFVRRTFSLVSVSAASILFGLVTFEQSAAQDVRRICSEKYQSAKKAGTLNDETWPQFYGRCTTEAKANAAVAEATAAPPLDTRHICSEKYQAAKAAGTLNDQTWPQFYGRCTTEAKANAAAAEATAAPPLDIRHICSEKYQAAKAAGTLNGETWPQFYSQCTAETKANPPAITATPAAPVVTPPVVAAPTPPAVETPAPPVAAAPAEEVPAAPVAEAPAPPPAVEAPAAPVVAPAPAKPLKTPASKPGAPTVAAAPSTAVFPSAISPTYANEKPYKARLKTCSDQYKANKAVNANGGLKWIQKGGGGYWSECNKHLQG